MKRTLLKRIAVDPKVMLGKPVIRGTRITVELILEKLAADISIDEILADYPAPGPPRCPRGDRIRAPRRHCRRSDPPHRLARMRFLADESVEAGIVALLRTQGHDVLPIGETAPGVRDERVLQRASSVACS